MPEGDSVYSAADRLRRALVGRTLSRSDFRVPRWATVDLVGAVVTEISSRGKHLFIIVRRPAGEQICIHSHLLMDGVWQVHRVGTRWRRAGHTARLVLAADDVEAVGFDLGILELVTDPEAAVAHLGPDLLGDDWDVERAAANLAAEPQRPIGLGLLDQRMLAGIGNVYRSELCFMRRVHPSIPASEVDLRPMLELAHRLLTANRLHPRSTTGVRAPGRDLWVYGRDRRPCRRCGHAIVRSYLADPDAPRAQAERSIYVCPACQPT